MISNLILIFTFICSVNCSEYRTHPNDAIFLEKCVNTIYRECTHESRFTEEQKERARLYIQSRFLSLKKHRPQKPPCSKIHVRKNFKCLAHEDKMELARIIRILYDNGVMKKFAERIHAIYWPPIHKFIDFVPFHRWFNNELQKQMKRFNPNIVIPYWTSYEESDQPEYSILWDYLGRAGNKTSSYCVRDGTFADLRPCVRRQWDNDSLLPNWAPKEFYDYVLQNVTRMPEWYRLLSAHFKTHLAIGGWMGQMSNEDAPYDFSFYPFHEGLDVLFFKWQLQNDDNLMPESYNEGLVYDLEANRIRSANLTRDRVAYFNASIREAFQIGFGDLCYVPDVIVKAINQLLNKEKFEIPDNYKQMPKEMLRKYYFNLYSGKYSPLDFVSLPVANCNRRCRPIRQPKTFASDGNGKRMTLRYKYLAGIDESESLIKNEEVLNEFIDDLNRFDYCSPFIIS